MSIKRSSFVMSGADFFASEIPIFVNRAYENFEMHTHSHEFVEITYVSEGAGMHYIADEAVPAEQGTLFFIPVGHSHVFRPKTPQKERPLIVYNCLFPVSYLSGLRAAFPQAEEICGFFGDEGLHWFSVKDTAGAYHLLFQELYREFSAKPPGYLAVLASLIVRILTGMYRDRLQTAAPAGDKPQWLAVDEAIAYIRSHYAGSLKLGALAAGANLSERQFSRLFQAQTGMSFTGYVQSIRMEAACRLLRTGRAGVAEIAAGVGYADLKFFHRLFKQKIGMTPRQYRNAALAEEGPHR
ncbi:AraC family transcriptional regulator [Paenibacillus tepidiphilus]|uniref:AraC family transcriptional regulator n=1 Tax=Paenibacillus tepidiphilus TaxID=2608683 RepID=UPI00123A7E6B|nr:AraC family transcriptional regulator [Paenibacillus tepidiphilus]